MTTQTDADALVAGLLYQSEAHGRSGPMKSLLSEAATHITTQAAQIAALTERVRVLMEYLGEQAAFAQTRIQDGIEMGATVWRIALEDIARENHTALKGSGYDD